MQQWVYLFNSSFKVSSVLLSSMFLRQYIYHDECVIAEELDVSFNQSL